ncbi:MAG: hypothetical protein DELT_01739 [Desulfovibrio sp.]
MPFPSLDPRWGCPNEKPRIMVLEVREPAEPHEKVCGYLLVEREETPPFDAKTASTVAFAWIRVHYQRILPETRWDGGREVFSGSYSRSDNAVSITSSSIGEGGIDLRIPHLQGHRIGTYLMNEIVRWVKQWPTAAVRQFRLSENDGYAENKERRNRFYEQFGIEFEYTDDDRKAGISRPMTASSLNMVNTWEKNISEYKVQEFMAMLLRDNATVKADVLAVDRANKSLREELYKAIRAPLRWAFAITFRRYAWHAAGVLLAGAAVYRLWAYV